MAKRKTSKKPARAEEPAFPRVFEMFMDMTSTIRHDACIHDHPAAFNGFVRVRRYRVTIERIEEPVEVLRARLVHLWRTTERNIHSCYPLRHAATELGMSKEEIDRDLSLSTQGVEHKKAR